MERSRGATTPNNKHEAKSLWARASRHAKQYEEAVVHNWHPGTLEGGRGARQTDSGGERKIYGKTDVDTLLSMTNLASTFCNQGRRKETEQLERLIGEVQRRCQLQNIGCILTA
jgi:hypothetical protein